MLFLQTWCFTVLLLQNIVDSEGRILRKIKERVRDLQLQNNKEFLLTLMASGHQPLQHVKEAQIYQKLNHFNRQDGNTFPQRFFVNEAYWQRPDGPVFLFIGGEGPIYEYDVLTVLASYSCCLPSYNGHKFKLECPSSGIYLSCQKLGEFRIQYSSYSPQLKSHHVAMAKEHGALLLAVEHRFYGNSINLDGLKTENLVDLSSQQALADLAVFHEYISQSFNLSCRNTWISFGGSYSGALSAWFRGKFPSLVFGAVASSAPVMAKLDFSAYNNVVGLSLMNEAVGGSRKCLAKVQEAFVNVEAALMSENSSQVAKDFGCCQTPKNPNDQVELMQNLADIIMGTVQYNEEGVLMSINELCEVMTNSSDANKAEMGAYDRLVRLSKIYRSSSDESCLDISHEKTMKDLLDTTDHTGRRAERQWTYQTCTEFGFYQTCEDNTCPFSGMLTLQAQTELCAKVFGISQHSLPARVAFTNSYYGGADPHTHRVLYVNGGVDPWKELSVVQDRSEEGDEVQTVFIADTAHCADMANPRLTDRLSLRRARQEIQQHVASWLRTADLQKKKQAGSNKT